MARRLPKKDVVIVGLGWTGSIMAHELTDEGLDVIAIERGPWRDSPTDFPPTYMQDELRYRVRHELFLRPDQTTFTFRNKMDQTALPIRTWGAFMPPNGVGGGGVHWNAETFRFLPSDFVLKTHLTQRYGASFLPADMTIQDWGVTYDDLEPHYDQFEYLCGTSGTAGNLKGEIQEGGNPFEGPRSRPYPTPAQAQPFSHTLFAKAARELGYKPFPQPSGNLSRAYTNPLGVRLGPCTYCGFCEWFGCANYSKASPQTTILPVLVRKSNFSARDNSEVTKINVDRSGEHATGVTFVDSSGEEWEQPADLVILSAYSLFNVQLLLLSGIGLHGSFYAYRDVYLDLDPTYKDRFGRPLMRMTVDFHENEVKQNRFLVDKFAEIIKAMGANQVAPQYRTAPYDITIYQTTHLNGGAIMGADPKVSAINRYLQSWDVSNLFVLGASAFPQNAGYNPTGTVGALAFWAAAAIRNQYLKQPGPLVDA